MNGCIIVCVLINFCMCACVLYVLREAQATESHEDIIVNNIEEAQHAFGYVI